jgi:predicted  nucleic acid-binding Zn-ribbon protein
METMTKSPQRTTERLHQTVAALARLLDQTMNDIQTLDSEFQDRSIAGQELQNRVDELLADRDSLRQELTALKQAAVQAETERSRLSADYQAANELLKQAQEAQNRALAEADEAAAIALEMQVATAVERFRLESTRTWDAERAQLIAERDQIAAELEQTKAGISSEPMPKSSVDLAPAYAEVARVEDLIAAISQVIEDPTTELSVVIRKSAERAELESYLRGIRFIMKDE